MTTLGYLTVKGRDVCMTEIIHGKRSCVHSCQLAPLHILTAARRKKEKKNMGPQILKSTRANLKHSALSESPKFFFQLLHIEWRESRLRIPGSPVPCALSLTTTGDLTGAGSNRFQMENHRFHCAEMTDPHITYIMGHCDIFGLRTKKE